MDPSNFQVVRASFGLRKKYWAVWRRFVARKRVCPVQLILQVLLDKVIVEGCQLIPSGLNIEIVSSIFVIESVVICLC